MCGPLNTGLQSRAGVWVHQRACILGWREAKRLCLCNLKLLQTCFGASLFSLTPNRISSLSFIFISFFFFPFTSLFLFCFFLFFFFFVAHFFLSTRSSAVLFLSTILSAIDYRWRVSVYYQGKPWALRKLTRDKRILAKKDGQWIIDNSAQETCNG